MSQVKLEGTSGLGLIEMVLPDLGKTALQAPGAGSFGDYLLRVRARSDEPSAGGPADSARPGEPQAVPPSAGQQSACQRQPPADDQNTDRRDSGNVSAADDSAGQSVAEGPTEGPGSEAPQSPADAGKPQPSATAAAEEDEAETDDSHKPSGKLLAKGQLGLADAPQSGCGNKPADLEKANAEVSQDAALLEQVAEARLAAEGTAADAAGPSARSATPGRTALEADGAAAALRTAGKTLVRKADGAAKANGPSANQGDDANAASHQQQASQIPGSQAGTPLSAELPGGGARRRGAADEWGQGQPQAADPASATISQANRQMADSRPTGADVRWTELAGDRKLLGGEEAVRLASLPNPDGRLAASVRALPTQEPQSAAQQPRAAGDQSVQIDRARFVQRVAQAFGTLGKRDASVRLRLSPPELGSLRLEISVRNGLMTARIEAETPAARNLLLDNLPVLRDRLALQDIKVKQFDVNLMDRSPDGLPNQSADHMPSQHHNRNDNVPQPSQEGESDAPARSRTGAANRPGEGTQLNVII